jgi:acetyl-CoA acetyltransferase
MRVAIAGVAESDLGEVPGKTVLQMQAEAALAALAEAGLQLRDVDGIATAGGEGIYAPGMLLAEYLGVQPRYTDSTNIGGASFVAHAGHACEAIRSGQCGVVLISYASRQRSQRTRALGTSGAVSGPGQFERIWGLPVPVGAYALAATRHMHEYGTRPEQLAEVAIATRKWAALNPKAFMRDPITIADVLASRWIAEPLHLLDCCLVTDGGGAVVIVSEERARDLAQPPIWILGHGEAHTHLGIAGMPDLTTTPAALSGRRAFETAGLRPDEMDVVEVYDSFTITVLLTLEALGFCRPGDSGAFVSGQRTAPGGDFPMNTNGGGLSYCHPGMYGIFTMIEAARQLRGECGPRQVEGARLALANGTGGVLSSAATLVLGRD